MPRSRSLTLVCLALWLGLAAESWAHSEASGIVKQRMDAMTSMARAMKSIAEMIKGTTAFEADLVLPSARLLIRHAKEMPALFPDTDHSRAKPTEALPDVWTRWAAFSDLAERLEQEGAALMVAGFDGNQEAITRQFTATAKVCRDCHGGFRKPKD